MFRSSQHQDGRAPQGLASNKDNWAKHVESATYEAYAVGQAASLSP